MGKLYGEVRSLARGTTAVHIDKAIRENPQRLHNQISAMQMHVAREEDRSELAQHGYDVKNAYGKANAGGLNLDIKQPDSDAVVQLQTSTSSLHFRANSTHIADGFKIETLRSVEFDEEASLRQNTSNLELSSSIGHLTKLDLPALLKRDAQIWSQDQIAYLLMLLQNAVLDQSPATAIDGMILGGLVLELERTIHHYEVISQGQNRFSLINVYDRSKKPRLVSIDQPNADAAPILIFKRSDRWPKTLEGVKVASQRINGSESTPFQILLTEAGLKIKDQQVKYGKHIDPVSWLIKLVRKAQRLMADPR